VSLAGEVAVVTGAGRGIGRAIAVGLAAEGMRVGLLGRTRETLEATLGECVAAGGTGVVVPADVANIGQLRGALDTVCRDLGEPDLVVNNAGRRDEVACLPWEGDPTDWWLTVETNLRGPYLLARRVLPDMVARGSGRLLQIGSGMAHGPQPAWSAYGVSKAALSRFTDSLAAALDGTGVTVLELSPGLVRTDMTETMWGPADEQRWNDVARTVAAVVRFARGDLDALHGRFVHAARDDLDALLANVEQIRAADARTLRLRAYGDADPLG
jgi:3-oxoacyl-[acyl-carrier protein] reductase